MAVSQEAQKLILVKAASNGKPWAWEECVENIYAAIPSATREMYPADKEEAVVQFADTYFASYKSSGATLTPQTAIAPGSPALPALTAAQTKALEEDILKRAPIQQERTLKTAIEKILLDKPKPSEYTPASLAVVPVVSDSQLAKYEEQLVQNEENIAAFNQLKQAVKNGTPVAVYVNDKSIKTLGYVISTPSEHPSSAGVKEEKIFSTKKLLGYISSQLAGYINDNGSGLSAKLVWAVPKANKSAQASITQLVGSPRLRVVGKADALKDPQRHEVTSQVKQGETRKGRLRTALSFKVRTGEVDAKNVERTRTVRFTGIWEQAPVFQRSKQEYVNAFPIRSLQDPISVTSKEDIAAIQEAQIQTLKWAQQKGASFAAAYGLDDVIKSLQENAAGSVSAQAASVTL
ncbi:MAG: hypothetical protein LBS29_04635 [Endomicrobium sp.]|jgi:hypothetical protein|nr:hypothetical protein [Endomicrobium sp.]